MVPGFPAPSSSTSMAKEPSEHPRQLPDFRSNYACRFVFLLYPILTPPCFCKSTKLEMKTVIITIMNIFFFFFLFVVQH